jgi:hypothetical protein
MKRETSSLHYSSDQQSLSHEIMFFQGELAFVKLTLSDYLNFNLPFRVTPPLQSRINGYIFLHLFSFRGIHWIEGI